MKWLALKLLRFYQLAISPLFGPRCKYYPSCSNYAIEAIRVQGTFKGIGLAAWRVLRCNPWRGGFPSRQHARGSHSTGRAG